LDPFLSAGWSLTAHGVRPCRGRNNFSLLSERFFYKRGYYRRATTAISADKVIDAVMAQLDALVVSAR
jgi:hypothetical protein